MNLQTALAFKGEQEVLKDVEQKLLDDGVIDDLVESLDLVEESTGTEKLIFRAHVPETSWVNIYDVHERLGLDVDVIAVSTDSKTFVDIVSISGVHDAFVNDSTEQCIDICEDYGLDMFIGSEDLGDDDENDLFDDEDYF